MNRILKLVFGIFLVVQVWTVAPSTRLHPEPMSIAFVVVPLAGMRRRRDVLSAVEDVEDDDSLQYGAWGEARDGNTIGNTTPFRFTGRWGGYTDARLGKVLNWNRWYGPQAGRWGSRDPIGIEGSDNFYEYTSNSPGNYVDPTGLKGGPYHPPEGVPIGCTKNDSCTSASAKMWALVKTMRSHKGWDKCAPPGRGGNRHGGELDDFGRAHAKCTVIIVRKCGAEAAKRLADLAKMLGRSLPGNLILPMPLAPLMFKPQQYETPRDYDA